MKWRIALSLLFALVLANSFMAQIDSTATLWRDIMKSDSLLFEVGFNTCDTIQMAAMISSDFEFYHDISGKTGSKDEFMNDIRSGLCSMNYQAIRKLDLSTVEMHTFAEKGVIYAVLQNGEHGFYKTLENGTEVLTSVGRFSHLWILDENSWHLSRAYSFDHQIPDRD
ncbi:MAG: nuclear transport factor 2 family protein [Flavobacteriales bacterium]|nr:nuclear transport factor 2 family protein [Flavobacteriales bacterium]